MTQAQEKKRYCYFDKPDGEDVGAKLVHVLKPTSLIALAVSTIDVMLYSHPKGYIKTLGRYAYVGLPIVAVSTVFVGTSNVLGSLRNKNDRLNWFLGGFTAGTVFGVWRRSPMVGFNMGIVLGVLALVKKDCALKGWELFPSKVDVTYGSAWITKYDWTLTSERPRNWTTGK